MQFCGVEVNASTPFFLGSQMGFGYNRNYECHSENHRCNANPGMCNGHNLCVLKMLNDVRQMERYVP